EVSQLIGEVGASTINTLNDYGIIDKKGKSGAIARGTVAALQTANNGGGTAAIATNALAPVVSYEIGQHYKGENAERSLGHIAAHAALGAVTATANGGNALAGAASAALGEYTAQAVSEKLYGTDKAYLLGEKEQATIIGLSKFAGAVSGAFVGDSSLDTIIGSNIAETAVENNQIRPPRRGGIQSFRNEQMRANYKMQLGRVRQYIKGFNGFDSIRPLDETGRAIYSQSEIDQLARFADFVIANQNRGWTQQDFVRNFNQRGYNSPAPENLSPPNSGRQGAINAAKRNELIPTLMLPTRTEKNTYPSNGQTYTGNVYYYTFYNLNGGIQREYRIRDDLGGHYQGIGNPQNRGPHFNIERNTLRKDERGNYIFEDLGKHYDY
ncbi:MAG: VENN motif pre-toxin domain-containing protein, partial [Neisseriaceae bacterium]|nr:VENN motif pre-toxin domain-containing protein [Neisseriaceae bacterium]